MPDEPRAHAPVYSTYARARAFELLEDFDVAGRLGEIAVPMLIVVGREDVLTPLAKADCLHAATAGSELVVLDGCSHFNYAERPEECFAAVRDSLSRTPA